MFNEKWPILPDVHNTDSTSNLVSILLGHGINDETICQTVPKCVDVNAIFLVNTSEFSNLDDVKCDDNGSWINNGVRKLYCTLVLQMKQTRNCSKLLLFNEVANHPKRNTGV